MGLFRRRKETLNERLLREAGLSTGEDTLGTPLPAEEPEARRPAPIDPFANQFTNADGRATYLRPREYDVVVLADAAGIPGDELDFATLPDGTLIVDDDEDADLSRLADAVESQLQPPYRAHAVRRDEETWSVGASRIEVVTMKAPGDAIQLVVRDGERTATIDGEATTRRFPPLEALGERCGADYVVDAETLDGDLWEARATPL